MTDEFNANEAFEYYARLQHSLKSGIFDSLNAGMYLCKIREQNRYRTILGNTQGTWAEFLASPELTLTYSTANKLMRLYEVFKIKFNVTDEVLGGISESKLKLIGSHLTPENQSKLLSAAATQSYRDLEVTVAEIKQGKPVEDCEHSNVTERLTYQCQDCKSRFFEKPN